MFLTWGAVDTKASRFTVLARGAMETFIATALPVPIVTILTFPVIGAPTADVSRAFKALVAVVTGATVVILRDRTSVQLLTLFSDQTGGNTAGNNINSLLDNI